MTNLDYEGRHDREDQIWEVQAHPQTVEWIWRSSFAAWASSNDELFWICGKPGSGKSVLMERIARSNGLEDNLKQGLNEQWTIVHHFFFDFCVSGDIRNNFEGFLRSLLYQLIGKFGNIREGTQSNNKDNKKLSKRELQEKLGKVLEERSGPVCILLDGLDEYQDDKWDLVKFLQETAKPQIKLCVASRPDLVFDTAFQGVQQIKMQDQNKPAIKRMVDHTLQESMERSGFYSNHEYISLAEEISEKADGVFLWARFAVKELRAAWVRGEELERLQKRLEEIPGELEDIYARILERIKPYERQHAAYMLQLVCYAKRLLTVPELFHALTQIDNKEDSPATRIQAPSGRHLPSEHMAKRVFALTGGLLEIFRGDSDSMEMLQSEDSDSMNMSQSEDSDSREISQFEDSDTSEHESLEYDYINIIHRTVRTYLERGGWEHILGRAHAGTLHAEMLWLRACARSFPPSFVDLPPKMDTEVIPKRIIDHLMPLQNPGSRQLIVSGPVTSLRNYAAQAMLDHARGLEDDLGVSSYTALGPFLTDNFVCHHRYLGDRRRIMCTCFAYSPEATHPLHLAIAHGLDRFVGDFLFHFAEKTWQDSPEWNNVFYLEEPPHGEYKSSPYGIIGHRISLLEFAVQQASHTFYSDLSQLRIVNTLLERYSRIQDVEMIYALRICTPDLVQLFLKHWPNGDLVFNIEPTKHDPEFESLISLLDDAENYQQKCHTRPLWHIARRKFEYEDEIEELLDIFLKRGEDINGQCGPVGTALHGSLLRLAKRPVYQFLLEKGADVNAHGPLGKPLELVWRLAHTKWGMLAGDLYISNTIEALIHRGAINERPDPNGSVPSKEQMRAFQYKDRMEFAELLRHYKGKEDQDETASTN